MSDDPTVPPPLPDDDPGDAHQAPAAELVDGSHGSAGDKPSKASLMVQVLGTLGVLLFITVIPLGAASMPWIVSKARGYHDVVFEPLRTCQIARDALGENPRFSPFGNNSSGSRSGLISWTATVRGSEARGTYMYSLRGSPDAWELVSATLLVDGYTYRLMDCARREAR